MKWLMELRRSDCVRCKLFYHIQIGRGLVRQKESEILLSKLSYHQKSAHLIILAVKAGDNPSLQNHFLKKRP